MGKYISFIFLVSSVTFSLSSCKTNDSGVKTEKANVQLVTDSIYTMMPGKLLKLGNYLAWHDPFGQGDFIHVIDIAEGKEIGTMGKTGQGPEEFNTSVIASAGNNNIFVFDLNTPHQAIFSTDSLKEGKNPYSRYADNGQKFITTITNVGGNGFIILQPKEKKRFRKILDNETVEFGDSFIKQDIDNGYDVFQGIIRFNSKNNLFVFFSTMFPYMEIYDLSGESPVLVYSSDLPANSYEVKGAELVPDRRKKGMLDMTLVKDYIVTIQRDYTVDNTDESTVGRDFSKTPKTIFIYDYKGSLKKILDFGIPVVRIAGDPESNTLYAIAVDPDFVIVKCEL